MSLSYHLNLTAAQSELLLMCAFGHYSRTDDDVRSPLLPCYDSPYFVATAGCLVQKGLLSHDVRREPTYQATPAGISIANLIAADARRITELAETAKPLSVARKKAAK